MYDEKNPDVVPYNEVDAEYKLKSETQTPSGHLGHSTDTELTNKSTDDRGMIYQNKLPQDELHYAELSIN
uniref:Uncharacterized protein n=1 Tax=Megaselia scalaris TaxID=36166 RepID=T1GUT9_MEGSC